MAISARTQGTWETASSNATSYQFAIPTHQSGDMLLLRSFIKPSNGTSPSTISPSIDQSWSIIASGYTYTNNSGNGSGSLYAVVAYKVATSSSETGPTLTFGTSTSPAEGVIDVWQKGAGEGWVTPVAVYLGYTSTSSISVTLGSNPGVTAGDLCVAGIGHADDDTLTSPNFTQTGITWGTNNEWPATANESTTGNDIAGDGCYRLASSGTATAAPVVTGSASAAMEGIVSFTRLRVQVLTEAFAGVATATGAAVNDTTNIWARATGLSSATGAALTARPAIYALGGYGSSTGAALDSTATTGGANEWPAGLATASGAAQLVRVGIATTLGVARGRSS